jgi:sugar phosphate permease
MRRVLLLPVFFITYALAYLDRANYGFGAAAGMAQALHLTESRSALLAALFFLGYFVFQVPGMLLARRCSATRLAFLALLLWGVLAALTGVIRSFVWLALDRLLLGVAESVIFPAMLLLLTQWFVRAEHSRANTLMILGNPVTVLWMSAITGYLIESVGWQRMFLIEGLPAVLWAFLWIAVMRDHPTQAAWMDPEQAAHLELEITAQQPDRASPETERAQLRSILLRRDVLQLCLQYFCWSMGVYGFVLWLPTIVRRGAELSMGRTGLLAAAPYLFAIPLMILAGRVSDRTLRRQEMVWPFLLLAGVAMLGSFFFARHRFPLGFVCLVLSGGCMYAPYGPFFAIVPERAPQEVAGEVFALVNSFGALGGFAGSYLVGLLHAVTGSQAAGYLLMSFALLLAALLVYRLPRFSASFAVRELHHA